MVPFSLAPWGSLVGARHIALFASKIKDDAKINNNNNNKRQSCSSPKKDKRPNSHEKTRRKHSVRISFSPSLPLVHLFRAAFEKKGIFLI